MSGWPSLDRADDERLARSLAAGDPGALIQVMDRYAARLYDYCHALLRDQESAARALHDALIAAYAHVSVLSEPDRFRGWLYTLVRNECLRRLRDPERPPERHEAPEVEDGFVDEAERVRRLEARQLVHSALSGMRGRERETLDLMLRHGLDATEIAGVLGMDVREATALAEEAGARLDDALAAAFLARTGRGECAELAVLAADGELPLPPPVTQRIVQHIGGCAVCHARRERVSAARLLQVLPVAMMPTDLRGRVMATATDPALAPDLAGIAQRAEPFDSWGWPVGTEAPVPDEAPRRRTPRALLPAVAAAAAVMLIVTGAFFLMPGSPKKETAAKGPAGIAASTPDPSEPEESPSPSESPTPTKSSSTPTPTPTPTTPTPTPTRTRTPSSRPPSPTPTRTRTGTLSVGGCTIVNSGSCSFSVRAVGGPVRWSVTGHSPNLSVGGGGGRLGENATSTVTVTLQGQCPAGGGTGSVSFSPNGVASITLQCDSDGQG
ncbi:sigma-70 family RNA polymerase sigma factor [Actinomadura graeca]|uniref:Sigma-70 family RNA polymerase sigma factor n=1 Tax=Actinomadura graeca TaxID=2750812 RepID=A0ABX8QRC0_9ACTN|nr:sigma-70 family RNA polymerase sigma factor [Actinomadura graeca]QXJ21328.1 sigma-70 family RNA polymerase sigma factor [Actinomadura graeca]